MELKDVKDEDVLSVHRVFQNKICLDEFKTKITKLTLTEFGNFLRASLTLQDSQTCMRCKKIENSVDIAMVLCVLRLKL